MKQFLSQYHDQIALFLNALLAILSCCFVPCKHCLLFHSGFSVVFIPEYLDVIECCIWEMFHEWPF